ncbi:flagellar protein FlgN [Altererythrobacter lutimaris]|uniref:Flagellar protein FlgN n=1 Tax=Altererythrobacter lutimaris TaxID=2743979 RepID=A0A850H2F5_9SPHN|nr:flagellar protein FlgN [Altererythrobacter lutimaris]NVE93294.1 flagellar protein FlgN [Altererythrobacter lutimaris]
MSALAHPVSDESKPELPEQLRQMIAVLEQERQALAAMDLDALTLTIRDKDALCGELEGVGPDGIDDECRSLAETARQLNDVNRRVRNLLAANVASRLEALGGKPVSYRPPQAAIA